MNPMILMSLFSMGMFFVMPKMMANMDPEALEEMKNRKPMEMPQLGDMFGKFVKGE